MKLDYEINDHGTEHAQYFQGMGVALSRFTSHVLGAGSSAREAGGDALEQFWQMIDKAAISVADAEALEAAVGSLSEEEDAHGGCMDAYKRDPRVAGVCARDQLSWDDYHADCEIHHYVSIRWRVS
jgi:hypothetical protein